MESKFNRKLAAIAIAQAFLLGSLQAYASGPSNTNDASMSNDRQNSTGSLSQNANQSTSNAGQDAYIVVFKEIDENDDGLLDRNEVIDDDIFDGLDNQGFNDRFNIVDSDDDGLLDQEEYLVYRTRIDAS